MFEFCNIFNSLSFQIKQHFFFHAISNFSFIYVTKKKFLNTWRGISKAN